MDEWKKMTEDMVNADRVHKFNELYDNRECSRDGGPTSIKLPPNAAQIDNYTFLTYRHIRDRNI